MAIETTGVPFGAYHLSANPDLYQPQLQNNFVFVFPDFGPLLKEGKNGNESDAYIYDVANTLQVSLISSDVPNYDQGTIEIRKGNSVAKYAGTVTWNPLSLRFNSFEGAHTKDAIMAWKALSYNIKKDIITSLDNTDIAYKQDCYLIEYSCDYRPQRKWKIINAFPSKVSFSNYDNSARDSSVTVDVTLQYDRAEIVYD